MKITIPLFLLASLLSCSPMSKSVRTFNFQTAYYQFYLEDKNSKANTSSFDFWTDEAHRSHLAMLNGIIGVGIYSYGNARGQIKILDKPSGINYSLYDHIVEGGINIESGELGVYDCPDHNLEFTLKVRPGRYRVRVYGLNFSSVTEPDLTRETDQDFYKIEIWPSDQMARRVLKQYVEPYLN